MRQIYLLLLLTTVTSVLFAQKEARPLPSPSQLKWQDMDYYLFVHFGPNTFTDLEWGKGTEHEEVFDPSALDCRQWCRIAKAAGAKGIIITAKHHDGFCLWPSKYSTHTVAQSNWRNGKGDVLMDLKKACQEYGLKMGVYLSPWDRNHPKYGTTGYNDVYINMMKEVVSRYGPFFEFWWDGANGEGPNGKKQVYDWKRFEATMRTVAPGTIVFSDIGPDARWVGNENGIAGDPDWNTLDTAGFSRGAGSPSTDTLNHGNRYGHAWIPAECDVSIRPGWFYHKEEDSKVKTADQLFTLYLKSVGRGANLLLNVPPDRRGLFNEHDSASLVQFRQLREACFAKNLAPSFAKRTLNLHQSTSVVHLKSPSAFNCLVLKEEISRGQRCAQFTINIKDEQGQSIRQIKGTTIGKKRILTFPATKGASISITIEDQNAPVILKDVEVFAIPERLVTP